MLYLRLLLVSVLFGSVCSQNVTNVMMSKIFKYAKANSVPTLTKAINSVSNVTVQNSKISAWAKTNFMTVKGSKDPLAVQSYAVSKAQQFMAHRAALKKFMQFRPTLLTEWITTAQLNTLIATYWAIDAKQNNNLTECLPIFMKQAATKLPSNKAKDIPSKYTQDQELFKKTYPQQYNAVFGFTL